MIASKIRGFNANKNGNLFEMSTQIENYLSVQKQFEKYQDNSLIKKCVDKDIIYVKQLNFRRIMKNKYNIDIFRNPDEAYIIEHKNGKKEIKILEKKNQNVEGTCETKLWSGNSLKREYEIIIGPQFDISYAFCVNTFLENKFVSNTNQKYITLKQILEEDNIKLFFGDKHEYFENLYNWIIN